LGGGFVQIGRFFGVSFVLRVCVFLFLGVGRLRGRIWLIPWRRRHSPFQAPAVRFIHKRDLGYVKFIGSFFVLFFETFDFVFVALVFGQFLVQFFLPRALELAPGLSGTGIYDDFCGDLDVVSAFGDVELV
jgi:hypothetical protein